MQRQPPEVFSKILQNSHESTCARVSYLIRRRPATLFKKRLCIQLLLILFVAFPVNISRIAFAKGYLPGITRYDIAVSWSHTILTSTNNDQF